MKKSRFKKYVCFMAAAVIAGSLCAGNATQAAGQTVSTSTGSTAGQSEEPTNRIGMKAEKPENQIEEKYEVQTGTDTAKTVTHQTETDSTEGPADQTGTNSMQEPAEPTETSSTQEPADATGINSTQETVDPAGTDSAQEPADQTGTDSAQEPADQTGTDSTQEPADPAGTDNTQEPDQADDENEGEEPDSVTEPEAPKLKKPVLKASSKPNGTIKLSWNKVKNAEEYVLLCSTKKDSGFHKIYTAKKGERVYKDEGRVPGKIYYYQLAVFSKGRASRADSKKVSGCSLEKPALTEISNISGSRNLVLHWNPVKGADGYAILRKNIGTGKYEQIGKVKGNKTAYTDGQRDGGTIYSYKVFAKDADGGRGAYSQAMSQMAIDKDKKMIALTYDDGPSAYTPVVLNALARYDGHATFFVVGTSIARYADSLRRAAVMGCEIGNHTYDHSNLANLSSAQVQSVINRTNQAVKDLTGVEVRLLRPPYGSYHSATFAAAGMPIVLWSIDTLDWKTRSTSATIQCIQQKAYDGAIVLMHDLHQPTVLAADAVMKYLKSAGYQLVTVSEMAAYRGGLSRQAAYSQFRK